VASVLILPFQWNNTTRDFGQCPPESAKIAIDTLSSAESALLFMAPIVAVLMDPIEQITPNKDTTLAMMLEAQRRGYELRYLQMQDLAIREGRAWARLSPVRVADDPQQWFELGPAQWCDLAEVDVVLIRKDPPFDGEYLYATQILELSEQYGTQVINSPQGLRDANEKLAALWFPQCLAPVLVSSDRKLLRAFVDEHQHAVGKVLDGMGGHNVFMTRADDPNLGVILDTLTASGSRYAMVQRYLPEIAAGDKRILMIDGVAVDHCLARIPQGKEFRGNLAQGGKGEVRELSDRDRWICEQVAPELKRRGLRFVGLDVIGDYLTEVNVTSPTCVREIDAATGSNIAGMLFDRLQVGR